MQKLRLAREIEFAKETVRFTEDEVNNKEHDLRQALAVLKDAKRVLERLEERT